MSDPASRVLSRNGIHQYNLGLFLKDMNEIIEIAWYSYISFSQYFYLVTDYPCHFNSPAMSEVAPYGLFAVYTWRFCTGQNALWFDRTLGHLGVGGFVVGFGSWETRTHELMPILYQKRPRVTPDVTMSYVTRQNRPYLTHACPESSMRKNDQLTTRVHERTGSRLDKKK